MASLLDDDDHCILCTSALAFEDHLGHMKIYRTEGGGGGDCNRIESNQNCPQERNKNNVFFVFQIPDQSHFCIASSLYVVHVHNFRSNSILKHDAVDAEEYEEKEEEERTTRMINRR